jgi:hypothetical protein
LTARAEGNGKQKEAERNRIQELMQRDAANMVYGLYDYTGNNRNHRKSDRRFKENLEAAPGELTADSLQKTAIQWNLG